MLLDEFGQAEMPGQGGRKEQPGIGYQAWSSKVILIRSRWFRGSIY